MKEARSYWLPSLTSILTSIVELAAGELTDDVVEEWEMGEITREIGVVNEEGVACAIGVVAVAGVCGKSGPIRR